MKKKDSIKNIKKFWEKNPLYKGEINKIGNKKYFEKIYDIFKNDVYPGEIDKRLIPNRFSQKNKILDLGSGPGLYVRFFYEMGLRNIYSADLTTQSNKLVKKMCKIFNYKNLKVYNQNAEKMTFKSNFFDHVNCIGVIHHSENPELCIKEIARVLKKNGSATIGVYYDNFFVRNWSSIRLILKIFNFFRPQIKSRGRSKIHLAKDKNELVRLYDGKNNPKGISYSKNKILQKLKKYFIVDNVYYHFFPKRFFNIKINNVIHRLLDKNFGFLIYVQCKKK